MSKFNLLPFDTVLPTSDYSSAPLYDGTHNGIMQLDAGAYYKLVGILQQGFAPANSPIPVMQDVIGGVTGVPYNENVDVVQGTEPYTYAIVSGALPTGLSLNTSTGVISGTPTVVGSYTFEITVTDVNDLEGSFSFTIEIVTPSVASSGNGFSVSFG